MNLNFSRTTLQQSSKFVQLRLSIRRTENVPDPSNKEPVALGKLADGEHALAVCRIDLSLLSTSSTSVNLTKRVEVDAPPVLWFRGWVDGTLPQLGKKNGFV